MTRSRITLIAAVFLLLLAVGDVVLAGIVCEHGSSCRDGQNSKNCFCFCKPAIVQPEMFVSETKLVSATSSVALMEIDLPPTSTIYHPPRAF